MSTIIRTPEDIDDQILIYLENEAFSLSQRDELVIENYVDREVLNPEILHYLDSQDAGIEDVPEVDDEVLGLPMAEGIDVLTLSAKDERRTRRRERRKFRKLKRRIQRIFCDIVSSIEGVDFKEVLKGVLIALIPAFAAGIPALLFPIIIGIVALYMKRGFNRVCPV